MCDSTFNLIKKLIKERTNKDHPGYLDDYARIYSVILDKNLIKSVLIRLADTITAPPASGSGETNWMRFSSILTYFEKKCWFYEDVLLPLGVLKPDDFYHYIRCGYVLKDYGAGVKHGEFTHRLQWHVIMAVITNHFTCAKIDGWNHSPFDLYISLGKQENRGAWGFLLDNPREGMNFSYPDRFHAWLMQNAPLTIKLFLVKRETKRREQFIYDICRYIEAQSKLGVTYKVPDIFLPNQYCDPKLSHEDFKKFEKWFATELYEKQGKDLNKTEMIYNSLADQSTLDYAKRKTADPKMLNKPPKHRSKAYVQLSVGPVYALSGVPVKGESEADARAGESGKQLQAL